MRLPATCFYSVGGQRCCTRMAAAAAPKWDRRGRKKAKLKRRKDNKNSERWRAVDRRRPLFFLPLSPEPKAKTRPRPTTPAASSETSRAPRDGQAAPLLPQLLLPLLLLPPLVRLAVPHQGGAHRRRLSLPSLYSDAHTHAIPNRN